MNLENFLKSNKVDGYNLDTSIENEDFFYSEDFTLLLNTKNVISFDVTNEDLSNNDFLTLISLIINEERKDKNFLEFVYTNKDQDDKVDELYKMLNLIDVNFAIVPSENVEKEDYLNILLKYREVLNSEKNKIKILPIDNFVSYNQLKLIIDNFADINESNKGIIDNLLHPTPQDYLKEVLFKNKSEEWFNEIKNDFFNKIPQEEKKVELEKISNLLYILKENLFNNKDLFNIYIK